MRGASPIRFLVALWMVGGAALPQVQAREWRVQLLVQKVGADSRGNCGRFLDDGTSIRLDPATRRLVPSNSGAPETFVLVSPRDAIMDGDRVQLRSTTTGKWVCAEGGGGGVLVADRGQPREWETFTISNLRSTRPEDRRISHGEQIGLVAANGRAWRAVGTGIDAGGTPSRDCPAAGTIRFRIRIERSPSFAWPVLQAPFRSPAAYLPPIGFDHRRGDRPADQVVAGRAVPGTAKRRCEGARGTDFPNCYDDHEGTDFSLKGWFPQQDLNLATEVVAALAGEVVNLGDGNVDHCFPDPSVEGRHQIRCIDPADVGRNEHRANFVQVAHAHGIVTSYYHLQKNSVTVKVGDRIEAGHRIGRVGSSGISSGPHLHFHLEAQPPMLYDGSRPAPFESADIYVDPYKTPDGKSLWNHLDGSGIPDRPAGGAAITVGLPFTNRDTSLPSARRLQHPDGHKRRVDCVHRIPKHPQGDPGPRVACTCPPVREHGATCQVQVACAHWKQPHGDHGRKFGAVVPCTCPPVREHAQDAVSGPCTHMVAKHRDGHEGPRVPCTEMVVEHAGGHEVTDPCTHFE